MRKRTTNSATAEEENHESAVDGSDQSTKDWGIITDSIGIHFLNYRWLYGNFNLCVIYNDAWHNKSGGMTA